MHERVYALLDDDEVRVCKDIAESACNEQPRNFLAHVGSLALTKTADSLINPKLTLAWLLTSVGAPAFMIALLVPVREALSLLPQLMVAAWLRRRPVRKWAWVAGSMVQALCVIGMVPIALLARGAAAGWGVLGLLALFSLARGVCSIAAKDVLGKTVSKTRRGTATGYGSSIAGICAASLALVIMGTGDSAGDQARDGLFFAVLLGLAGALWLAGAGIYALVHESPGATAGGADALAETRRNLALLRRDPALRDFLITRGLLVASAFMTPYVVVAARQQGSGSSADLGLMLLAAGLAGAISASFWGRFSDRSSRLTMVFAALLASLVGLFAALVTWGAIAPSRWLFAAIVLLLAMAHEGIRLGRKTHLVDMAGADNRASYVALSNTLIGVVLLAAGGLTALLAGLGNALTIVVLSLCTLLGMFWALRLDEVQRESAGSTSSGSTSAGSASD
ncbi:MAG: MFS transporter [Gammaproteobacteria bacterium]|nr:MFS transporter [Gammaproteobacteria bacterium]